MGDANKCLDIIIDFFNNGESQFDAQGNKNEVYKSVLNGTVNKILDLNNEDRITIFNSDNNPRMTDKYKYDHVYYVLSNWKQHLLFQSNKNARDNYYLHRYFALDPESRFYRQGDRVFYEYVKRDNDNNIVDKLIAEVKFHDKFPIKNKKTTILSADEASILVNNNVYNLTDEDVDNLINEIMKHKNYNLIYSNIYDKISNDMDRVLTAVKFGEHNSSKSSDSYVVNNMMLENLVENGLKNNKDVLNHDKFALTFHCHINYYNKPDVHVAQYSLKIDEKWLVTTNVAFDKQKKLILQYVLTSRDGMRKATLTAQSSKDVFAVKDDNGVWSARENKTRKFECDRLAKNIPLSSDIVYEFDYKENFYS